jgi:uncharacterized membrane protein YfcA
MDEIATAVVTGLACGLMTGLVGMPSIPLMVLFSVRPRPKAVVRATVAALSTVEFATTVPALAAQGLVSTELWREYAFMATGNTLGFALGWVLHERLGTDSLLQAVRALILLSAALLVGQGDVLVATLVCSGCVLASGAAWFGVRWLGSRRRPGDPARLVDGADAARAGRTGAADGETSKPASLPSRLRSTAAQGGTSASQLELL